MHTRLSYRMMT